MLEPWSVVRARFLHWFSWWPTEGTISGIKALPLDRLSLYSIFLDTYLARSRKLSSLGLVRAASHAPPASSGSTRGQGQSLFSHCQRDVVTRPMTGCSILPQKVIFEVRFCQPFVIIQFLFIGYLLSIICLRHSLRMLTTFVFFDQFYLRIQTKTNRHTCRLTARTKMYCTRRWAKNK